MERRRREPPAVLVEALMQTIDRDGHNQFLPVHTDDRYQINTYAMQAFGVYKESHIASALKQRDYKDATDLVVISIRDCNDEDSYTYRYVRRLTPNECSRLQGFPDGWSAIRPILEGMETEELAFWKQVTEERQCAKKSEKQLVSWYNRLHSDSAEYKMWGNGVALPSVLYCMDGIRKCLAEETAMAS